MEKTHSHSDCILLITQDKPLTSADFLLLLFKDITEKEGVQALVHLNKGTPAGEIIIYFQS